MKRHEVVLVGIAVVAVAVAVSTSLPKFSIPKGTPTFKAWESWSEFRIPVLPHWQATIGEQIIVRSNRSPAHFIELSKVEGFVLPSGGGKEAELKAWLATRLGVDSDSLVTTQMLGGQARVVRHASELRVGEVRRWTGVFDYRGARFLLVAQWKEDTKLERELAAEIVVMTSHLTTKTPSPPTSGPL